MQLEREIERDRADRERATETGKIGLVVKIVYVGCGYKKGKIDENGFSLFFCRGKRGKWFCRRSSFSTCTAAGHTRSVNAMQNDMYVCNLVSVVSLRERECTPGGFVFPYQPHSIDSTPKCMHNFHPHLVFPPRSDPKHWKYFLRLLNYSVRCVPHIRVCILFPSCVALCVDCT